MATRKKQNMLYADTRSGFTIIEVVLVLAIAGLIFLMVFIALPQLQRAQRDTQRRQDIAKLQTAIETYQGNNNGRLPAANTCTVPDSADPTLAEIVVSSGTAANQACRLIKFYMHDGNDSSLNTFVDPGGNTYDVTIDTFANAGNPNFTEMDYTMHVLTGANCNGEEAVASNNPRDFAIVYRLEGSGIYCHGNNG